MHPLQDLIETAFEQRTSLTPNNASPELLQALTEIYNQLDQGKLRIAEKIKGTWQTHEWLKKVILISFRVYENQVFDGQFTQFFDKLPLKFAKQSTKQLQDNGVRIVPPACARHGAYIAPNTIMMPSYVNTGAYIDSGCLIDTWATIGSCAQIGKNVHISGGAGIGGVLEPLQANPTIIEDNVFIGARSEVVEGVIVEENAVISMGVFLGQSTKIYNRETKEISYGRVPSGAVVIPGNLPAADGSHSTYCAVIIKQVDAKTRSKVSLNDLLRI